MASAANSMIGTGPYVHIFHELPAEPHMNCEVCSDGEAAYAWTKQSEEDLLQRPDQSICRVCAGMILLVGTTFSRF